MRIPVGKGRRTLRGPPVEPDSTGDAPGRSTRPGAFRFADGKSPRPCQRVGARRHGRAMTSCGRIAEALRAPGHVCKITKSMSTQADS